MHRIVTKVKALLIRSGRAFAPSYISVGSRNYSVIIVKAIHQSSFFHRSCRILNATYLVSTEFLLFVLTRRAWRKKKKKNFKRKNKKSSRKESEISLSCWFFLSLFFSFLQSTLIAEKLVESDREVKFSRDKRNFLTSFPRSPLRSYVAVGRRVIFGPPPVGSRACSRVTRS